MLQFKPNITEEINSVSVKFHSLKSEHSYRQYFFFNDKLKAIFTIVVSSLLNLAFINSDFLFIGYTPLLEYLIAARIIFFVVSVICSITIWRLLSENVFDWILFGWTIIGITLRIFVNFTRPPDFAFDFTLDVLIMFYIYILVPITFKQQFFCGSFLTIQSLLFLFFYKQVPPLGVQVILSCIILGNFLGLGMSWYFNLQRRTEFHLLTIEKELKEKLQRVIAELKVLKGSLPICSSCKKIRDEHQHWHPIENYIRDRSEAEFSHSICPDCVRQLYPHIADSVLSSLKED